MELENIIKDLREKYFNDLEREEGITKEDLQLVDLSIGFTPVIPCKDGPIVEVAETIGGNYIVGNEIVDPEALKVMRYRYLSNRKNPFAKTLTV